jgi:hypothetical protein
MSVASLQLIFDNGTASGLIRPGKDGGAVGAALRVMLSEAGSQFHHVVCFRMADGSRVIAKPKATP